MSHATFHVGDVFDVLATIPDASVDLVLTSPPFLALRSYLPADHPDKAKEIGSEPNPAEFIDTLLRLTAEWLRVLTDHGSLAVELGDTYSGSGGAGGDYANGGLRDGQPAGWRQANKRRDKQQTFQERPTLKGDGWPLAKSLCLIPELYRVALVYGIHPLTGLESPAGRWRARNVVRWVRPNPPVGALGDKFRPATSDLIIACTSPRRWFDLDAVREPGVSAVRPTGSSNGSKGRNRDDVRKWDDQLEHHPAGAPPLDWWEIPPGGYSGAHYATWPAELCVRPIKAMCPQEVCRTCGEPRRRIVEASRMGAKDDRTRTKNGGPLSRSLDRPPEVGWEYERTTVGWTDCGHADYRPGVVLDPFAGSGTTLMVATGHGRNAIGIDIDSRNADLARDRIGMFLTVIDTRKDGAA